MSNTSNADDQAIREQQELLTAHRERLAILLAQYAHFGAHVPPHILTSITEAQTALRPIKAWLRAKGIAVADEPNDEAQIAIAASPSEQPSQSPNQTINNLAPNQGAQGIFNAPISFGSTERDNE